MRRDMMKFLFIANVYRLPSTVYRIPFTVYRLPSSYHLFVSNHQSLIQLQYHSTEARWHVGMSSASDTRTAGAQGSNSGKGDNIIVNKKQFNIVVGIEN